jgi:general secretion pathway protein M
VAFLTSLLEKIPRIPFRISKRERIFVGGGAVLAFVVLAYHLILNPIMEGERDLRNEIVAKGKMLAKYQDVVKQKGRLERDLKNLKIRLKDMEDQLLDGESPSLAAANVQDITKEISSGTDLSIKSVRVLPSTSRDIYTEIPVRVETQGTISGLRDFLYEIQNYPKFLVVKEIRTYLPRRPRRRRHSKTPRSTGNFRATLVIMSFIKQ